MVGLWTSRSLIGNRTKKIQDLGFGTTIETEYTYDVSDVMTYGTANNQLVTSVKKKIDSGGVVTQGLSAPGGTTTLGETSGSGGTTSLGFGGWSECVPICRREPAEIRRSFRIGLD